MEHSQDFQKPQQSQAEQLAYEARTLLDEATDLSGAIPPSPADTRLIQAVAGVGKAILALREELTGPLDDIAYAHKTYTRQIVNALDAISQNDE